MGVLVSKLAKEEPCLNSLPPPPSLFPLYTHALFRLPIRDPFYVLPLFLDSRSTAFLVYLKALFYGASSRERDNTDQKTC